jgi:hypothetical protein
MNTLHTPLPWTTEGDGGRMLVRGSDATIVALRHRLPGEIHKANAELIVRSVNALPDLVKALEDARAFMADRIHQDGNCGVSILIKAADAALAKVNP